MKKIHAIYENGVFRPTDPIELPENCEVEFEHHAFDESSFRRNIDEGLAQLDAGDGIEHKDAKQRLGKWSC